MPSIFDSMFAPILRDKAHEIFGESVTYTCQGHAPVIFTGEFVRAAQLIQIQGEVQVSVTRSQLDVWLADLPAVPRAGDSVTIGAEVYKVTENSPDGFGTSTLTLALQT